MTPLWTIKPHTKGTTFRSKKITFPFEISNYEIKIPFRISQSSVNPIFQWDTSDGSIEKISATEIVIKERIINFTVATYT